ncbi:MAG: hypothetical protein JTT11_06185 [Candidatus Brockarchaeota archaeon]|nr:hypothetical protein [Candidatus Brockarchaeota archaeon]
MAPTRVIMSASAVVLLSLAASFALLYVLSGKNELSLGGGNSINLTSSFSFTLWGMLLGLCAGGFSVGMSLAPDNQAVKFLFSSYGGDWFLLVTAALVLIGLAGGLLAKHALRGAVASGVALLALAFIGVMLTATELPKLAGGLGLPSGHFSQFLSAVEISQVVGGCFAALVASMMGALGGRALQYREKVPIDSVKPPAVTFVKPATEGEKAGSGEATDLERGREIEQEIPQPAEIVMYDKDAEPSLAQSEGGPLSRPPPCPHCGAPLLWIPETKRYYCKACATYP